MIEPSSTTTTDDESINDISTMDDVLEKETTEEMTPVVETVQSNTTAELDKYGIPWNEKFHSANKSMTEDGAWRMRRGADKDEVKEYNARFEKPIATQVFTPPTPVVTETTEPSVPSYEPIPIPQNIATKPAHTFDSFKANFVPTMAGLVHSKELTPEYIGALNQYFGTREIMEVKSDDTKCRQLFTALVQGGKITQVG
jgi:hypothetical protein